MAIPRAELNGLLLICKLVPSIVNALKPIFNSIYFYNQSKIIVGLLRKLSQYQKQRL